jgi:hypothetical protein
MSVLNNIFKKKKKVDINKIDFKKHMEAKNKMVDKDKETDKVSKDEKEEKKIDLVKEPEKISKRDKHLTLRAVVRDDEIMNAIIKTMIKTDSEEGNNFDLVELSFSTGEGVI